MLFCQDKEIGVEAMERKRIEYIDWLRIISAIAVIGIHITMTQPNNYSVQEIGKSNYTILTCVYTLIQWAVPVFLMISGNLLLHSNKLAFTKVKKMSLRMGAVLLLFGSAFALLEQVFERKTLEIGMLPNSVLMTLQQKSWSHLWYLYILIGIYLILIPLKRFIDNSSNREICIFTAILIFGNFVIPTINIAFGTKIENYMLFTQYVTYVLLGYIIGGLHAEDNGREKKAIDNITNRGGVQLGLWLFASVIKIIIQYAAVMRCGEGSALILGDRIFTMIQALSVFCLFKKYMDSIHVGRLAKSISRCSFGIYLIHPFFINLLYKMVDITPIIIALTGRFEGQLEFLSGGISMYWPYWLIMSLPIFLLFRRYNVRRSMDEEYSFLYLMFALSIILFQVIGINSESYRISLYFMQFLILLMVKSGCTEYQTFRIILERWCILIFLGAYYVYFFIIALFNHVYPYTSSMLGI